MSGIIDSSRVTMSSCSYGIHISSIPNRCMPYKQVMVIIDELYSVKVMCSLGNRYCNSCIDIDLLVRCDNCNILVLL